MNICLIVHLHRFSAFLMLSLFPDNKLYFLHKNSVYARVLGSLFAPFNSWMFSRKAFCSCSNGFVCESGEDNAALCFGFYQLPSVCKHLFANACWCPPQLPPPPPEIKGVISFGWQKEEIRLSVGPWPPYFGQVCRCVSVKCMNCAQPARWPSKGHRHSSSLTAMRTVNSLITAV